MWGRFFIPDYVSCSGTLDLVTCAALLTSDDSIGFDMERPYSARILLKPDHARAKARLSKRHNQVLFNLIILILYGILF